MTAFSNPILVQGGKVMVPTRIDLGSSTVGFSEEWLQGTLFESGAALPFDEFIPSLRQTVPVCRELNTLAGPVDLLYIGDRGQIVLVETKLWRNPESRRKVVAQILDYAAQLTQWTYEDLAREVARATGKGATYLLERIRSAWPDFEEAAIVDTINRNLKTGDIALVIVGDGIRTGTEALVSLLEKYGGLRFTFGLVEIAAYRLGDGVLLQPRILAKTEILRREIVVVTGADGQELQAVPSDVEDVEEVPDAELNATREWFSRFWSDFLKRLRLDDLRQPLPSQPPKSTNLYFSMPPSGRSCWISAYLAKSSASSGVYLTWLRAYSDAKDTYEALESDRQAIEQEIGLRLDWIARDGRYSIGCTKAIGNLDEVGPREEALLFLADTSNRFINAMRPRIEAFLKDKAAQ